MDALADKTTAKQADHIREIMDLVLQGHSQHDIKQYMTENDGDFSGVMDGITRHFEQICKQDPAVFIGFALEGFRDLYRRSIECGDLSNAAKCLKEITNISIKLIEYEWEESEGGE